ncbi:gluconate 2-dehydrogenase subunit 3 family protein [Thalassomonas sp. M1454]|uniref:gluconate 2-dehydrogenase subunit 3 family protein n=1 Tax=Thalassomonas sp. M1454 TaxID=2594477 RepID=UPI00117C6BF7|nr:gluconate 2-dehydrogenase subunit 3 family protein [Thalassomonas sp. M1454]TRX55120.1 twin-arginine translocation signal domain-containing protein [Thalassomonas sp. M1454]
MNSFFDPNYQVPHALKKRLSRRNFLKSAALATAVSAIPLSTLTQAKIELADTSIEPWKSLDAVLQHLLPSSKTGPGAKEIQAIHYLYNVVKSQPVEQAEKEFISKGVGWLNGYTQGKEQADFVELSTEKKEASLRAISKSRAGENWISTLLTYIFEAMLSPPSYGGNPDGIGWKWLNHQAGFPLPPQGKRYYEIPSYALDKSQRIEINTSTNANKVEPKSSGKAL